MRNWVLQVCYNQTTNIHASTFVHTPSQCMHILTLHPFPKITRKSCSETNMKAALRYHQSAISNLI